VITNTLTSTIPLPFIPCTVTGVALHDISFTYPISITLDKHGGDPVQKMLYSYSLRDNRTITDGAATLIPEDRGFGGVLVNPAASVFSSNNTGDGGIDGGTGGCAFLWRNYLVD